MSIIFLAFHASIEGSLLRSGRWNLIWSFLGSFLNCCTRHWPSLSAYITCRLRLLGWVILLEPWYLSYIDRGWPPLPICWFISYLPSGISHNLMRSWNPLSLVLFNLINLCLLLGWNCWYFSETIVWCVNGDDVAVVVLNSYSCLKLNIRAWLIFSFLGMWVWFRISLLVQCRYVLLEDGILYNWVSSTLIFPHIHISVILGRNLLQWIDGRQIIRLRWQAVFLRNRNFIRQSMLVYFWGEKAILVLISLYQFCL